MAEATHDGGARHLYGEAGRHGDLHAAHERHDVNVGDPRRQQRFPEIEDDSSHDGDNLQVVRQGPWPPSLDSREDRQEAIVLSRVDDHGQRCRYRDGHGQRSARGEIGHRLCDFGDGVGPVRERDPPLELLNVDHVVREGVGELSDYLLTCVA